MSTCDSRGVLSKRYVAAPDVAFAEDGALCAPGEARLAEKRIQADKRNMGEMSARIPDDNFCKGVVAEGGELLTLVLVRIERGRTSTRLWQACTGEERQPNFRESRKKGELLRQTAVAPSLPQLH